MFTVCPGCHRQFRIYAEQIAAASGQVRCGFCHVQFNALERLHDQPLDPNQLQSLDAASELANSVELEEPQFEIPEPEVSEATEPAATAIEKDAGHVEQEPQRPMPETGAAEKANAALTDVAESAVINLKRRTGAGPASEQEKQSRQQKTETKDKSSSEAPYTFEEEQPLEEKIEGGQRLMRGAWSVAALVALLLISGQLAWFNRDRVLLEYPQLRPLVVQLCDKLDCSVIRERNTQAIKLLNRDVRLHPTYQDTLLVNATMENELPIRQPYPRVQLTLFDTAGALIGYREFLPTDYLDSSIDIDEGMPVDAPVHFVLEVAGSSEQAVSFEFRFL